MSRDTVDMFQCALPLLPLQSNFSFQLLTQKHASSHPKLKRRNPPPCVIRHPDNPQHGKSLINFTKVEASNKCIVQLSPLSSHESHWRKEHLMGLHSAVGCSHRQNSEQNRQEKSRFSALKLKQVQLIEFGGVLESSLDKITLQNAATSSCSPLHTLAPHPSLHKSVFGYTHRTSANAPPVSAPVEESNHLLVKKRSTLHSPVIRKRNQQRFQGHTTVAHSTRGTHKKYSAQSSRALVPASSYPDPMVGGTLMYHKRLVQMAAQVCATVQWEKTRETKKQRTKTSQKSL